MLFEKKNCKGERQALNTELSFFCEMLCRRSSAYVNCLSYFAFSLSTDLPNRSYCDSNTSKRIVVCIGLFISLRGDWRSLVCLIITYSWYGVRGRLYLIILRFSGVICEVILGEVMAIDADTDETGKSPAKF